MDMDLLSSKHLVIAPYVAIFYETINDPCARLAQKMFVSLKGHTCLLACFSKIRASKELAGETIIINCALLSRNADKRGDWAVVKSYIEHFPRVNVEFPILDEF